MATRFVNVDRETSMLFPPDLRDWVRKDDLVHFVLEAVELLPLSNLRLNRRGTGSEQYPPRLLLSLLIYSYATGVFSSRRIEGLTHSHVSVRYLCANTHPDHDTICSFRRENGKLLQETFVKVLEMAAELKFLKVGTIAIDGSKVAANASKHSAVSHGRAGELIAMLEEEVKELLAKAETADSAPLADGLSIPEEITRRQDRIAKLKAAREAIEQRAAAKLAEAKTEHETKVSKRQAKRERGERVSGPEPKPLRESVEPKEQINFTDPESRIMKMGGSKNYVQAYNAQAAVDTETMLIVGQRVSDAPNDKEQLKPTFESVPTSLGTVENILVDSGFYSEAAVKSVEQPDGSAVGSQEQARDTSEAVAQRVQVGPTVYAAVGRLSHHIKIADLEAHSDPPAPPENASAIDKMNHRVRTSAGKELYRLRKQTVEPVFGIVKAAMGFRQFSVRGLEKVSQEWTLVSLAWNFRRLHSLGMASELKKLA